MAKLLNGLDWILSFTEHLRLGTNPREGEILYVRNRNHQSTMKKLRNMKKAYRKL
jgi:hypothetical protein